MKKIITSACTLALALSLNAQDKFELVQKNTWPVSSINLKDTSDQDLDHLAEAIGKSRIVMLGGMDNNDGETIRAKARIVRYLHQRLGFSVLAMPSDFYGTNMLWDTRHHGDSALIAVPESITATTEFGPLKNYIAENSLDGQQLEITGYDIESSFKPGLVHFSLKINTLFKDLGYKTNDTAYTNYVNTLLAATDPEAVKKMEDTTFGYLKYFTKQIIEDIDKNQKADRFGFWSQTLRNYLGNAYMNWQLRDNIGTPNTTIRDRQKAANLLWIADQKYASRKIIVWADNQNISRNNETIELVVNRPQRKVKTVNMATELSRVYGADIFTIGFTSLEGKIFDKNIAADSIEIKETGRNDWFTNTLNSEGFVYAFTDFRTIGAHENTDSYFTMRAWNYHTEMKGDWFRVFDGMFYLKTNKTATAKVSYDYVPMENGKPLDVNGAVATNNQE
ncbi:MAG: erythromycin esterase family protein [Chitinophagaceae bacterium]